MCADSKLACTMIVFIVWKAKEGVYGGVCEYKIVCNESLIPPRPFPPCAHTTWGPGDSSSKFDMTTLHNGAIVNTINGVAEVRLRLASKWVICLQG